MGQLAWWKSIPGIHGIGCDISGIRTVCDYSSRSQTLSDFAVESQYSKASWNRLARIRKLSRKSYSAYVESGTAELRGVPRPRALHARRCAVRYMLDAPESGCA